MPSAIFIKATARVKYAAASANMELGLLPKGKGRAIMRAAKEIIEGKLHDQFIVDAYQAGAGTSHNMNANEVIANRAIEILKGRRGDYSLVHPNDHVNMAQSTNDTFPSAMRVAALMETGALLKSLAKLTRALKSKAKRFDKIIKSARTHLQDAVPIRLGQEFASYASAVESAARGIKGASAELKNIGLGATAAGTGINTHPAYAGKAVRALSKVSGIKGLRRADDSVAALNSMADFAAFSSALKNAALELIRIANDLRLLSSGPRTGIAEIKLPPVQPGSSIMPGKVNPVMAEMLNMVSFQVVGNDLTISLAAQAGQFELNVMGPVINQNILSSIHILTNAVEVFTGRCVKGIKADRRKCEEYFERSVGLVTLLNRFIGYDEAAVIARESERTGKTIREILLESKHFTKEEIEVLLEPKSATTPQM
jgi:aspartate ammonia-lyase